MKVSNISLPFNDGTYKHWLTSNDKSNITITSSSFFPRKQPHIGFIQYESNIIIGVPSIIEATNIGFHSIMKAT